MNTDILAKSLTVLCALAGPLVAESVTVNTILPQALGVFKNIRTTQDSWLAINSGNIGIGTTSPGSKLDVRGQISANPGSAAAPAYSFMDDLNTGIYSAAADNLSIATAGAERLRVNANGKLGLPYPDGSPYRVQIFDSTGLGGLKIESN